MNFAFSKYQGTGNDFVLIDNRRLQFPTENLSVIRKICNRRFGVGSDGLILIEPDERADFYMNFFNPDGSQSYCGNGSRCAVQYSKQLGIIGNECTFGAIDGQHQGEVLEDDIRISIRPVIQIEKRDEDFIIDTGSPHYIRFAPDVDEVDLIAEAHRIRYSPEFRDTGVNVNFVELLDEHAIKMRTYERGVEDETLSCGTGVTAAAIAQMIREGRDRSIDVNTLGGSLRVSATAGAENSYFDVWLSGPAQETFTGIFNCSKC